ncbi:hypothetical protein DCAR_0726894 [Daucus carota subsp. sativus]|uniref:Uncharacterized protein n=1 Tax=Daucus carota subsp. sativus TaxID=79200 RepID=A0AAF0XIK4_DAUCS|nr:PREDICTED: uncharacterized protein LOC108196836 isoform X1 [Daucus carota subsp. sativus]XP_017219778.1 PREDICTED: uncharacterized protein LOC108196836 isoform X1 [Daucus carota subsp. sativus]WOH07464.1 hypothetical protein DCAR_0726894 [Daucus carota subsp. sativus]
MSIQVRIPCSWSLGVREHLFRGRCCNISYIGYSGPASSSEVLIFLQGRYLVTGSGRSTRKHWSPIYSSAVDDGMDSDDSDDEADKDETSESKSKEENSRSIRENLERIVGTDDSAFSGLDLATLIRNKYGRSYDVQLIKKEFMGKNLLAMNVMWKYVEQKSFPLTEEEYLLRLDDVANTLKCWGAVSHIRDSLIKSKERPRIGKAVSIFIDMDESGGRANEWIYR